MTPGEALDQRIGAIERRLAKIETSPHWYNEVNQINPGIFAMRPGEVITGAEIERLRRIEKAAVWVVEEAQSSDPAMVRVALRFIGALRAALYGDPK